MARGRLRFKRVPDGLAIATRAYDDRPDAPPWHKQPDPGRALLVPLSTDLEDAICRLVNPRNSLPLVPGYAEKPAAYGGSPRPPLRFWPADPASVARYESEAILRPQSTPEWQRLFHDVLLATLRRIEHKPRPKRRRHRPKAGPAAT